MYKEYRFKVGIANEVTNESACLAICFSMLFCGC